MDSVSQDVQKIVSISKELTDLGRVAGSWEQARLGNRADNGLNHRGEIRGVMLGVIHAIRIA